MTKQSEWREVREAYLRRLHQDRGISLRLSRTWASTPDGRTIVLPAGSETPGGGWWIDYDEEEFARRRAIGAILLCRRSDGSLLDFGLPRSLLAEISVHLPLKSDGARRRYFNIERRGDRFLLKLRGGLPPRDITQLRGAFHWLQSGNLAVREPESHYSSGGSEGTPPTRDEANDQPAPRAAVRFFATVEHGELRPFDPIELPEGATVFVIASSVEPGLVPADAAFRKLVAIGSEFTDLPEDFASQHDHYAHGGPRR